MSRRSVPLFASSEEAVGDDIAILAFTGELDCTAVGVLGDRLDALIASDASGLVLDLRAVTFIDSTAIAVVIGATNRLGNHGRKLCVICEYPHVLRVLRIVGLDRVCPIYGSREEMWLRDASLRRAASQGAKPELDVLPQRTVAPAGVAGDWSWPRFLAT